MRRLTPLLAVCLVVGLVGCGDDDAMDLADAAVGDPPDAAFELPNDNLVPAVGSDIAVDIATWNIENFPKTPASPRLMADLITSLQLDFIAVQEIESIDAWNELVLRLRDHDGVLSEHTYGNGTYQKVGFIYRSDFMTVENVVLLFENEFNAFPRPPLQATVTIDDGVHPPVDFVAIVHHLKAGFGSEDRSRREAAMVILEAHVRQVVTGGSDTEVLVLGDFNEVLTTSAGQIVFAPMLNDPVLYDFHTDLLASSGEFSFIPSGAILDHIITTADLADELVGGSELIPRLDIQFNAYETGISDHLPVIISMPVLQ